MSQLSSSILKIGFIGAGNMAQCIGLGLLKAGFPISQLMYSSPSRANYSAIIDKKITCTNQNRYLVQSSDIIILATKPYQINAALESLKIEFTGKCLVSVAAGVTTSTLKSMLAPDCHIIRAMPNTPALMAQGMSGIYADSTTKSKFGPLVESIFSSVGKVLWIENESLMDSVTAISGSGPAYIFHLAEAMISAAIAEGFNEADAETLVLQTIQGAAMQLKNDTRTPTQLKDAVTSPGGTTEAALKSLQQHQFVESIKIAIHAATEKGQEISKSI